MGCGHCGGWRKILHQNLRSLPFELFKVMFAAVFWPFQTIWNLLTLQFFATAGIWAISFEGLCGIDVAVQLRALTGIFKAC